MKRILLSDGGGGEESLNLIQNLFFKYFENEILLKAEDAATLDINGKIAFTTDSFTVSPLFFEGGDIGKISIAGTINDLVSAGAKPLYLSCGFIIEEGFLIKDLEKILLSMQKELKKSGARIVTGDTKVVPKGAVDGIYINTAGVGKIISNQISANKIPADCIILLTNEIGNHGACILTKREGLELESNLKSDCASLWNSVGTIFNQISPIAIRDATRGGLSAVLNEWARASNIGIQIQEELIPIAKEVSGICEFLGFEPFELANEGTMVICLRQEDVKKCIEILQQFDETKKVVAIGKTTNEHKKRVVIKNAWGSERFLEFPKGELLPRIC